MLIVDGHVDLAYNTLVDGRDYMRSALDIRADEVGGPVAEVNGQCMIGLPELLQGNVAVIITTLMAIPRSEAFHGEAGYPNPEAAYQQAIAQLNIYRTWARENQRVSLITHREDLDRVLESWVDGGDPDQRQVGMVLLIENAEMVREPSEVGFWYEQGVRLIGPAWHTNRYTYSDKEPGPLTDLGRELLDEMRKYGIVLDLTHMSDEAARQALDHHQGPVIASHSNPRRVVPTDRMIPDDLIKGIAERGGMVGLIPVNWGIDVEWRKRGSKQDIHLERFVDVVDATCEIAGGIEYVGIGSDFDGGFGAESTPIELDTIADLPKVADALSGRGYSSEDVEKFMGGNWLRLLRKVLPDDQR
jgi:membrane dipeptidase